MTLSVNKPHCRLLRQEKFEEFNRMAERETPDLANTNLRGCDLREVNLSRADLRGAYLRGCDLRGVDLSHARLEGASIHGARIGGTLFPCNVPASEIRISFELGIRLRTICAKHREEELVGCAFAGEGRWSDSDTGGLDG